MTAPSRTAPRSPTPIPEFDVERVRADFPILTRRVHGKPLVYLDNAATAQKPIQVLDALRTYYTRHNANVHRAVHALAERRGPRVKGSPCCHTPKVSLKDRSVAYTTPILMARNRLSYDAIVLGAGHNGLACAAYLAKAGRSVMVLERRPLVGGATVTERPAPRDLVLIKG